MGVLSKIFSVLVATLGALAAVKTLYPEEITYLDFVRSTLFVSGWLFGFILVVMMIYQEERHRLLRVQSEALLAERGGDKDYLKAELAKSNISLNHLTSRLGLIEKPIPRSHKDGEDNGF